MKENQTSTTAAAKAPSDTAAKKTKEEHPTADLIASLLKQKGFDDAVCLWFAKLKGPDMIADAAILAALATRLKNYLGSETARIVPGLSLSDADEALAYSTKRGLVILMTDCVLHDLYSLSGKINMKVSKTPGDSVLSVIKGVGYKEIGKLSDLLKPLDDAHKTRLRDAATHVRKIIGFIDQDQVKQAYRFMMTYGLYSSAGKQSVTLDNWEFCDFGPFQTLFKKMYKILFGLATYQENLKAVKTQEQNENDIVRAVFSVMLRGQWTPDKVSFPKVEDIRAKLNDKWFVRCEDGVVTAPNLVPRDGLLYDLPVIVAAIGVNKRVVEHAYWGAAFNAPEAVRFVMSIAEFVRGRLIKKVVFNQLSEAHAFKIFWAKYNALLGTDSEIEVVCYGAGDATVSEISQSEILKSKQTLVAFELTNLSFDKRENVVEVDELYLLTRTWQSWGSTYHTKDVIHTPLMAVVVKSGIRSIIHAGVSADAAVFIRTGGKGDSDTMISCLNTARNQCAVYCRWLLTHALYTTFRDGPIVGVFPSSPEMVVAAVFAHQQRLREKVKTVAIPELPFSAETQATIKVVAEQSEEDFLAAMGGLDFSAIDAVAPADGKTRADPAKPPAAVDGKGKAEEAKDEPTPAQKQAIIDVEADLKTKLDALEKAPPAAKEGALQAALMAYDVLAANLRAANRHSEVDQVLLDREELRGRHMAAEL
jgi:hypothetical protein